MRIIMQMKWDGVTPDQYEQMRKTAHWEPDVPKGGVFHVAGFTDSGIHVTDIWESAEDFNNFVESRLMNAAAEAKVQGQPQVDIFPVHAIFVPALQRLN